MVRAGEGGWGRVGAAEGERLDRSKRKVDCFVWSRAKNIVVGESFFVAG